MNTYLELIFFMFEHVQLWHTTDAFKIWTLWSKPVVCDEIRNCTCGSWHWRTSSEFTSTLLKAVFFSQYLPPIKASLSIHFVGYSRELQSIRTRRPWWRHWVRILDWEFFSCLKWLCQMEFTSNRLINIYYLFDCSEKYKKIAYCSPICNFGSYLDVWIIHIWEVVWSE